MTPDHPVAAAWSDWLDILTVAGYPAHAMPRPPADPEELADAQIQARIRFPDELRGLYALADGQFPGFPRGPGPHPPSTNLFPTSDFLTVADALVHWGGWKDLHAEYGPSGIADFDRNITVRGDDPVRREYWNLGWWPLAMDGGGNFLAVDTDPAPGGAIGQVIVAGPDEDERRVLGTGVADYLRRLTASDVPAAEFPDEDPDDPAAAVLWWDVDELR
ncbi:cell wall assembly regulator SMI1 [Pseudonocardia sediminis]|uniref:Cell wall assembly regulator SMI1 n=1 Tax=Pseudonocardia sediminis TaxID=1397368 RepID=A0A4V2FQN8_PSEST|nr:SMI1/KNR4 family protein [Pseudonocardia sediminis]RZT85480.1 cell wall assembly regulator SMI1 [Pseudonocardia sediminis]